MDQEAPSAKTEARRLSLPQFLRERLSDTQRYLIIWIITGLACGLAAVAFHLAINELFAWVMDMTRSLSGGRGWLQLLLLALAPAFGGLLTGWILVRVAPHATGSGIPQTKARYYRKFGYFRLREAFYRFFLGTVSVGFGMSLGREGPTVHICAAIASKIGQAFGLARRRVQAMVPLGMGAGIAAAFNTPMAAVFFVFEELLGDFSSKSFFGIFICVVIAAVVQRLLIGEHPAFDIELGYISTDWWMLLALPLGIFSALLGKVFLECLLRTRLHFRQQSRLPRWIQPAVGGLAMGVLGATIFFLSDGHNGIFGIGYKDLDNALNGHMTAYTIVIMLLTGKLFASVIAYGSGGSGGLFAPTLFIGGMLGTLIGLIGQPLFGYENEIVGALALLGMGSFFAAVIRCPMTSIVIIWEMTGFYSLILPLMVGNMLAWLISTRLQPVPLYDSLLLQDKINLRKMPQYKGDQDWRNLPVSTIMTFEVVTLHAGELVADALQRIGDNGMKHHAYPVMDTNDRLAGMVTHHELREHLTADGQKPVSSILADRKLIVLHPEISIREAARVLVIEDVMQAPVISSKVAGRLLGIVTLHDITRQQNAIEDAMDR